MRLHRAQGNAHHVGDVLVLHVVQVAQLEHFLALAGQLVDGLAKLGAQLTVLYPGNHVCMAGLVIVQLLLIELHLFGIVAFRYRTVLQQIDALV